MSEETKNPTDEQELVSPPEESATEESATEESEDERRYLLDPDQGYGRRQADHPIKCLDCGHSRRMYWQKGIQCPMCDSPRFLPLIKVEKEVVKEVRRRRGIKDFAQLVHMGIIWLKNWKHSRLIGFVCLGIILIAWALFYLKIREVNYKRSGLSFEWSAFCWCKDCKNRFSLNECADPKIPTCPKCDSPFVFPIRTKRIAE